MVEFPEVAVVLLLTCCVRARDFDNCCSCPVVRCVPAGSLVFVPCPRPSVPRDGEVDFWLNKAENVAFYHFDGGKSNRSELEENVEMKKTDTNVTVKMHLNKTAPDGWAQFALVGVTAEDGGLYWCSARVSYPPPMVDLCNASTVDLRLEGHQCEAPVVCAPPCSRALGDLWVWIGALVALGVYALLVTVVASVKIVRINKDELNQNVYMNTKHQARRKEGHKERA